MSITFKLALQRLSRLSNPFSQDSFVFPRKGDRAADLLSLQAAMAAVACDLTKVAAKEVRQHGL